MGGFLKRAGRRSARRNLMDGELHVNKDVTVTVK
jgi:hypothetical protein